MGCKSKILKKRWPTFCNSFYYNLYFLLLQWDFRHKINWTLDDNSTFFPSILFGYTYLIQRCPILKWKKYISSCSSIESTQAFQFPILFTSPGFFLSFWEQSYFPCGVRRGFEEMPNRRACGHGDIGIGPHQIVAATLTLFQPEGADYAHHILMSPPSFESHRRACNVLTVFVCLSSHYQ